MAARRKSFIAISFKSSKCPTKQRRSSGAVFIGHAVLGMPGPGCAERFRGAVDMPLTFDKVRPALPPT
jgi:hypothetical protein